MAVKERRIKCAACGQRETVIRGERGPVTAYCDLCREERAREQARQRVAAMRARQRQARGLDETRSASLDPSAVPGTG